MALTHVELYEELKPTIGEKAARLMAEVIPPAENLATKLDIAGVEQKIVEVRLEVSGVRIEIQESTKQMMRWMLTFFIPVWAGTWATVVAIVLKH